jgi:quercetin dioxygenase-like cupin family protein
MKIRSIAIIATLAAIAALPGFVPVKAAAQDRETVTPAFQEAIPNIPGKSLIGLVVSYPPGGKTPAHTHARSAFIVGYVLAGSIRSQVNGGKIQVFHAGEHWIEPPGGANHQISENASTTEPASLLAIFVADTADAGRLTTVEK